MDANQPLHFGIHVYDTSPVEGDPGREVSLCPAMRDFRAALTSDPQQVQCRRCRELLNVIGLR